jgi:hypothetical protein
MEEKTKTVVAGNEGPDEFSPEAVFGQGALKKLPRNKDEFIRFLADYNSQNVQTINEFLDQYENE